MSAPFRHAVCPVRPAVCPVCHEICPFCPIFAPFAMTAATVGALPATPICNETPHILRKSWQMGDGRKSWENGEYRRIGAKYRCTRADTQVCPYTWTGI
ncbi:MAG: hypothetical protein LBQ76_02060 [Candidatus Fibromonas sp.]|nr:hypothetical protein [Candidatus Fibromonas sp.]